MASYGSDYHKLSALNALEVLALNNAAAREQLVAQGTDKMLEGLATMGSSLLRSEAASFAAGLKSPLDQALPSTQEHVQQARKTRIRYDNVRRTAITMMRGWDNGRGGGGRGGGRGRPEYDEE